jgi:hypothetical protein
MGIATSIFLLFRGFAFRTGNEKQHQLIRKAKGRLPQLPWTNMDSDTVLFGLNSH